MKNVLLGIAIAVVVPPKRALELGERADLQVGKQPNVAGQAQSFGIAETWGVAHLIGPLRFKRPIISYLAANFAYKE
jgi:hypothetical protein